ncbi:MAG: LPXTG cell wall anchor domain-containing protein [Solirubrobacteraceae bacterium]
MLLLLVLVSAPSAKAKVLVPPGNSGASQYVEVVPSAEGGVTPGAQSHNHARVLAPSTERSLKSLGPEGRAVASFAQATGTPHSEKGGRAGSHQGNTATPPTGSPIVKVAAVSSGSLGWGLPLALGLAALASLAVLVLRRRRNSDSD